MEIKEIQNLIKFVAKSGVSEVKIEGDNFKITIKNKTEYVFPAQTIAPQTAVAPQIVAPTQEIATPATKQASDSDEDKYVKVYAPIVGTFYRKPAPDKPPFVEVGNTINVGDTVCIIEAMKLFNEVESEVSGRIVKILVDDVTPVEFDQPLFLVEPL